MEDFNMGVSIDPGSYHGMTDDESKTLTARHLRTGLSIGHAKHFVVIMAYIRARRRYDPDEPVTATDIREILERMLQERCERSDIYNSFDRLIDHELCRRREIDGGQYGYQLTDDGWEFVRAFSLDDLEQRAPGDDDDPDDSDQAPWFQ